MDLVQARCLARQPKSFSCLLAHFASPSSLTLRRGQTKPQPMLRTGDSLALPQAPLFLGSHRRSMDRPESSISYTSFLRLLVPFCDSPAKLAERRRMAIETSTESLPRERPRAASELLRHLRFAPSPFNISHSTFCSNGATHPEPRTRRKTNPSSLIPIHWEEEISLADFPLPSTSPNTRSHCM